MLKRRSNNIILPLNIPQWLPMGELLSNLSVSFYLHFTSPFASSRDVSK